ncbi:MAG: signal peptide peptidase SppA [Gammaproteobacteria bacterium]
MSDSQWENHTQKAQPPAAAGWEREVLEKLAFAAINEQRTARRWSIFFKSAMFLYLVALLGIAVYPRFENGISDSQGKHTAVIDVVGQIAEDQPTNAESIIESLQKAVKNKNTKGIVLHLNTPGGTPVQADYIYSEIRRVKKEHPDLPIYAVISDICASGGYYIAAAADKIFANQASIVGSIGVIMNGFGFVDTMSKFGIERRLLTAGAHKAMLDPFSPLKTDENEHMQIMLNQVHQQFIDAVKHGRGTRLKENPELFSGLVWTGAEGLKLGLIDDFGSTATVAKNVVGAEKMVNFTQQERLLDRLASKLGATFAHGIGNLGSNWLLN